LVELSQDLDQHFSVAGIAVAGTRLVLREAPWRPRSLRIALKLIVATLLALGWHDGNNLFKNRQVSGHFLDLKLKTLPFSGQCLRSLC
jgi:hypothetical protein